MIYVGRSSGRIQDRMCLDWKHTWLQPICPTLWVLKGENFGCVPIQEYSGALPVFLPHQRSIQERGCPDIFFVYILGWCETGKIHQSNAAPVRTCLKHKGFFFFILFGSRCFLTMSLKLTTSRGGTTSIATLDPRNWCDLRWLCHENLIPTDFSTKAFGLY